MSCIKHAHILTHTEQAHAPVVIGKWLCNLLCSRRFHYTCLAWLPYYFASFFSVDLMHASQTALFPPLAGIAASAIAGPLADSLIGLGIRTPYVRKGIQGASFIGPLIFIILACTPDVSVATQ